MLSSLMKLNPLSFFIFLIDPCLPVFHRRFAVNRASRVCAVLPFSSRRQRQEFIKVSSIAIWNKNRVVAAISLGVWVTNIAFIIEGEPKNVPFCLESRTNPFGIRSHSGNESIQLSVLSGINIISRSALHGYSRKECALYLTLRVANLISSSLSSPTSRYRSSCSLVCSACAVMGPVLSVWDGCCGSRCESRWGQLPVIR